MEQRPLVSVIIPAYNHEQYIEEALDSVMGQVYTNIELIVINDGSKDRTAEFIERFISSHQSMNIQFISKQNEGVCKTLNKGLEISTGEYVAFLASDDIWLPERVSRQVEFMENNRNIGLLFSDALFLRFNTITDIKWSDYKPGINKYFKNGIQNTDMYTLLLTQFIIPAVTVIIRKEVINKVGLFDGDLIYEDDDMWLRIAREYPIAYIDVPLALYRLHDSNISSNTRLMIKGMVQTINKHLRMEPLSSQLIKRFFIVIQLVFNIVVNRIKKMFKIKRC